MKLYTDLQLREVVRLSLEDAEKSVIWSKESYPSKLADRIMENLTPIELPSDEEKSKFTIDYFNWLHTNQYKYNPKVKMYQKMMINETLFFTIEELMIEFNKIQGGNNEQ